MFVTWVFAVNPTIHCGATQRFEVRWLKQLMSAFPNRVRHWGARRIGCFNNALGEGTLGPIIWIVSHASPGVQFLVVFVSNIQHHPASFSNFSGMFLLILLGSWNPLEPRRKAELTGILKQQQELGRLFHPGEPGGLHCYTWGHIQRWYWKQK